MGRVQVHDAVRLPRPVITIEDHASLSDAVILMRQHGIHHLVVVHQGQLAGIMSDRDVYALGLAADGLSIDDRRTVRDIMTTITEALGEDDDLRSALQLMKHHGVSALPLTEAGRLVGVVTESDLFRVLDNSLSQAAAPTAAERGKMLMANPLIQRGMTVLAEAGI